MILWTLTYVCLFYGLHELKPVWFKLKLFLSENRTVLELRESIYHLKLLEEMLETGAVPEKSDWKKCESFPKPWGEVLMHSITDLRDQGAPVLPTLGRIQKTLEDQVEFILEAKTKSSQAFGQAWLGLILVPVFSLILYFMMPGIQAAPRSFFLLVVFSMLLAACAFIWMLSMVESARFGNLRTENRRWFMSVHASLERMLALISTGLPPDLAWKSSMEELAIFDQTLVNAWKLQVWDPDFRVPAEIQNESERLIFGVGLEVRKSIQTSLLEGRPCVDRVESVHRAFQVDLRALISKELNLLPNRCLKTAVHLRFTVGHGAHGRKFCDFVSGFFMIAYLFRAAFFWILFATCIGGKNWEFPHGFKAVLSNARDYRARKVSRQDHLPLHPLNLKD